MEVSVGDLKGLVMFGCSVARLPVLLICHDSRA